VEKGKKKGERREKGRNRGRVGIRTEPACSSPRGKKKEEGKKRERKEKEKEETTDWRSRASPLTFAE